MSQLIDPKDSHVGRKAIMVIGTPGGGKTLLSSTAPGVLIVDAEGRAEHTHKLRLVPRQDSGGYQELKADIAELKSSKREGNHILFRGNKVETVVLDTVDRVQEFVRMHHESTMRSNKQQFYGKLLDDMMHDIVWPLLSLPINVILVCHTRERGLDIQEEKANKNRAHDEQVFPEVGLALEGQVRDRLWNYFDNVLHVIKKQNGSTVIITDGKIVEGRYYQAKDKTRMFGGAVIPFTFNEKGEPQTDAIQTIFSGMVSTADTKVLVDTVRKDLLAHAILRGVMQTEADAEGAKTMKVDVMAKLKADLDKVTEKTIAKVTEKGKELIDNIAKSKEQAEPEATE